MTTTVDGTRRDYSDGAVATVLTARLLDTDNTAVCDDASTFPQGASGHWVAIIVDRAKANQEKMWYSPRSGNQLQNLVRGTAGAQAFVHEVGATVEHDYTALDANEANRHVTDDTQDDHQQYVHTDIARTITANNTVTGGWTFRGLTVFQGDVQAPTSSHVSVENLLATNIGGNTLFTGNPTFANAKFNGSPVMPMGTAVVKLDAGASAVGTDTKPAHADHKHDIDLKAMVRVANPAGTIKPWAGASLPTEPGHAGEWAFCDGSTVSATTYPAYFANTGLTTLPDLRGKVLTGVDGSHALGAAGGSTTHALSTGELASHSHGITEPNSGQGHLHTVAGGGGGNRVMVTVGSSSENTAASGNQAISASSIDYATTGVSVNNTGSNTAFNIEQPWHGVNFIVKLH